MIAVRTKGYMLGVMDESEEMHGYVCMYVWSSHIAEYGSTG